MKSNSYLLVPLVLLATPFTGFAVEQLIPAGSIIQCTVSEPKISSKTTDVGDPVLCQANHVAVYGRPLFPYGSYLVGHFEDYKDPGHLVGKGWMELKFDRMMIPPSQVLPLSAKVVYVPKYQVDKQGRIHGNGHPVRDAIEWAIPVLWPIDLLNLPRRGPRPVLKAETRLSLKVMDDVLVPPQQQMMSNMAPQQPAPDAYGFAQRPMSYAPAPAPPVPQQAYAPRVPPYVVETMPDLPPPPPVARRVNYGYGYAPAPQRLPVWVAPQQTQEPLTILMLRDGNGRLATDYWFEGGSQIRYISMNGTPVVIPMEAIDLPRTVEANQRRGVTFTIRSASY